MKFYYVYERNKNGLAWLRLYIFGFYCHWYQIPPIFTVIILFMTQKTEPMRRYIDLEVTKDDDVFLMKRQRVFIL